MAPSWKLWRAELANPTEESQRHYRPTDPHLMSGYWRVHAARTKIDQPVAIWTEEGKDATIFQIGPYVMNTVTHPERWQSFIDKDWMKCTAILRDPDPKYPDLDDWSSALNEKGPGVWKDGKPSREQTDAEKADIIPSTPASEGGNQEVDENGDPVDAFWQQIKDGLEATTEQLNGIGPITSLDVANRAAAILERHRALSTEGEKKRKAEKAPFDEGAAQVQAKWTPVLNPAIALGKAVVDALDKFRRAEEARLKREREEAERKERERIAAEERERLAAEEAERARQAEQMGMEHQAQSEEEIAAEADARAAEQVAAAPQIDTKVRVGTAHGRGVAKATVWGGRIDDIDVFFQAVKDYPDVKAALQTVADRLGRAKAVVPGYTRIEK